MKKSLFFLSALVIALVMLSCGKNIEKPSDLKVTPNPLVVKGGMIEGTITGSFPAKKFPKKAVLQVTPILKFGSEEIVAGETVTYVGEKSKETGKTVSYKNGAKFTQNFSCTYDKRMMKSKLALRFSAKIGSKEADAIPDMEIAEGVIATATRAVASDNRPVMLSDKFQRIVQALQEADVMFLIQQANLRNSETKAEDVVAFGQALADVNASEKKQVNRLEVAGYASPDGKEDLNAKLAENRQKVVESFLKKQLKKNKMDAAIESNVTAEDWAGFQQLMENSNIQDKEVVLRVLSMYTDPEEREAQIKNLSEVYKNIATDILPQLRRSRMILVTDLIGRSDEEIAELAKSDPAQLSVEELLYAATLTNNIVEKGKIFQQVTTQFPNEYRGYNNLGAVNFLMGKTSDAMRCFQRALSLEPTDADVNYNAGIAAMEQGDLDKAQEYLGKAGGSANTGAALATLNTIKGNYNAANYNGASMNNAAVQQILNEDYAGARRTLSAVKNPNATTSYLLAVVGARTNDRDAVYSNLRTAISKDASLKAQAQNDIEFAKFAEDETFLSIVK
ncbi:MAG: tetratricopeptide repeat protein [Paludibacteraceae bacterium]|nr:tetratricopeptide repeat protein [Paludibacteraceae bacterium]